MRYKYTKEELGIAVEKSLSIAGVCKHLGLKITGGNYKTLNKRISDWDIDITHFTGQSCNKGENFKPFFKKIDLDVILVENSTYQNRKTLKKRLYEEGLKNEECEKCGNTGEWMDEPISLQLDHINGVNNDNRIDNLRILCPNCHSQTPTYSGKNKIKNKEMCHKNERKSD